MNDATRSRLIEKLAKVDKTEMGAGLALGGLAPLALSRNRFLNTDLPGTRLTREQLRGQVRRGDILLTGKPASMSSKIDRAIALSSGTPNAYHAAQIAGINEHSGNIFVHDHGPSGTQLSRELDETKNVITVLRPKNPEIGERAIANMEARGKLTGKIYEGLRERGVPEDVLGKNLKSFYSPYKPAAKQLIAGIPGGAKATEESLAIKLDALKKMEVDLPKILDDTAQHLKVHGKLPEGTPLKTLNDICTTALASAGAPVGKGTNVSEAMGVDFLRAAGPGADKAYDVVGHYIPEYQATAGKWATRFSKALHPTVMAAAGIGAGIIGTKVVKSLVQQPKIKSTLDNFKEKLDAKGTNLPKAPKMPSIPKAPRMPSLT